MTLIQELHVHVYMSKIALKIIPANCPHLVDWPKGGGGGGGGGESNFYHVSLFLQKSVSNNISSKFRNIPIFKDFLSICSYFLGLRVGRYEKV